MPASVDASRSRMKSDEEMIDVTVGGMHIGGDGDAANDYNSGTRPCVASVLTTNLYTRAVSLSP